MSDVAQDKRTSALRKWRSLIRMTTANGCTAAEARTAAGLAKALSAKFGFDREAREMRPDFYARYARAEARAAGRWSWEYRKCGKPNCHCARSRTPSHGPYKYSKRRRGKKVVSIYVGK